MITKEQVSHIVDLFWEAKRKAVRAESPYDRSEESLKKADQLWTDAVNALEKMAFESAMKDHNRSLKK